MTSNDYVEPCNKNMESKFLPQSPWSMVVPWNSLVCIARQQFFLQWHPENKGKKLTFNKLNMTDWMMQGANQNTKLHVGFDDSHCTGFFISNYSYALTKHFNYQATRALRHFGSYSRYWRWVVKQSVEPISIIHLFFRMIPSKCWFLLTSNDLQ